MNSNIFVEAQMLERGRPKNMEILDGAFFFQNGKKLATWLGLKHNHNYKDTSMIRFVKNWWPQKTQVTKGDITSEIQSINYDLFPFVLRFKKEIKNHLDCKNPIP